METTITFHTRKEDKELIDAVADKMRLSTSSLCRIAVLEKVREEQKNDN